MTSNEERGNDLEAVISVWLQQCGSCDFGVYGCSCPTGDYRPTMSSLVVEVEQLRAKVARVEAVASDPDFANGHVSVVRIRAALDGDA